MTRAALLLAAFLCEAAALPASAIELIGQATEAKNDVTGTLDELVRTLQSGDGVSANEVVKTGAGSATLIAFLDDSVLNIGASSTVVLDQFVFNPEGSADSAVLNLTKGAFRFVTGKSDPSKFVIQTQVATLGIRGTDFVVLCDGDERCGVVVSKGVVKICPQRDQPVDCPAAFDLDRVRNAAIIGPDGDTTGPKSISPSLVAAITKAVASGADGLTTAMIALGFDSDRGRLNAPRARPINASPG
jgi:hypothetical protein